MKTNSILVVLLLASRIVCADGFVTLTAVDATGFTSFSSGAHWSDGQIPTGDKDYLVAFPGVLNTQIRSPERSDGASFAFPGRSLTIGTRVGIVGEADVAGYYLSKTVKGQVTVNDMRLVNGFFYLGSEGQHYHQGNITVLSPEGKPFTFVSEAKRDLTVRAKISGEPGTALSFKTSRFNLEGDNRGFKGQLRFENGATIYANSVNCFGGARDVFDPDALYFDGATITYTGSPNAEIGANNNIGVTVAGQGCAFSIQQTLQFTADVTGSGTFTRRDTHTCTLDVFGAWSNPLLVHDSRGYLKIRPSATFAADCSLVISNGFVVASPDQVEDWLVITNRVVFAGGGVSGGCIVTDGVSAQQAPIRFEGPLVIEKPIRLAFYDPPSGVYTHETLHPLLQIPVSVRVVTADDFVPAFDKGAHQYGDLPKNAEVVVRTENGMQTVCLRFDPFVFNKTTANPSFFDTASHWSDNRAAHADADYVARNYDVRQSANPSEKYTFPGRSLLLQSDVEAHGYVIKQKEVTIGDLHVYNKSYVSVGGRAGTTGEAQCLKGRLTIHSTTDGVNGFSFIGSVDRVMTIDS